jgi:Rod binding domain-containing protein
MEVFAMTIDPLRMTSPEMHRPAPTLPALLRPDPDDRGFAEELQSILSQSQGLRAKPPEDAEDAELKKAFTDFVGQTLFGQLIASMRTTQSEPAYMHGGQAEKIFQNQLDQVLSEEMTKASADSLANPMYELFRMSRPS